MYYCEGKMVVELSDLDALRRTIARMYGSAYAVDVRHNEVTVALFDRMLFEQGPRKDVVTMPALPNHITAKRHQHVIRKELHDVWFYNDVAICSFYVKPV